MVTKTTVYVPGSRKPSPWRMGIAKDCSPSTRSTVPASTTKPLAFCNWSKMADAPPPEVAEESGASGAEGMNLNSSLACAAWSDQTHVFTTGSSGSDHAHPRSPHHEARTASMVSSSKANEALPQASGEPALSMRGLKSRT